MLRSPHGIRDEGGGAVKVTTAHDEQYPEGESRHAPFSSFFVCWDLGRLLALLRQPPYEYFLQMRRPPFATLGCGGCRLWQKNAEVDVCGAEDAVYGKKMWACAGETEKARCSQVHNRR